MMKNKIMLGLVTTVLLLLMTFMVSAIDISYSDNYLPKSDFSTTGFTSGDAASIKDVVQDMQNSSEQLVKSKYPEVQITTDKFLGIFGGDPIMNIKLIDHTEYCTIDCYSVLNVNLYQNAKLIDELQTRSYVGNSLEYTNSVNTTVYILKNVSTIEETPVFETRCDDLTSPTAGVSFKNCLEYKTGVTNEYVYHEEFVEYHNEELAPGDYIVKIVGKKNNFNQVVDWVPTIQGQQITQLAWWNVTDVYGNGSMGDVFFSVSTKTFGNMTLNVDYTVAGNTLNLMTDKVYQFNSFYLGPGTTLSTQNVTGAVIYIMSKNDLNIQGTIDLRAKHQPGQFNSTSFSYLGDSFSTPSVANGANAYIGGGQSGGFGGGATSGAIQESGCPVPVAGTGATGGFPFGNGGAGGNAVSTNDNCIASNGGNGVRSGGGGSDGQAYDTGSGCTITGTGGAGGGSYGANGGNGASSGSHTSTWSCTSGSVGGGGGGAGGSAGQPGYNIVLRGMNLTIVNTINLAGTNGTKGGNGGQYVFGSWGGGSAPWHIDGTGDSGYGGGGGGGASAGNAKLYYRYLTNSSSLNSLIVQTAGNGGAGGTWASGVNPAGSGGNGNAGTFSLNAEGFVDISNMVPQNNTPVVIPPVMTFSATITPTLATLVNATFYLWNNGTLNNTQTTALSGTSQVNVSWNRTSAQVPDGFWSWGITTCFTDGTVPKCINSQNNTFTTFSVQFDPASNYTNPTYEMINDTFSMHVSSTGFVNLSGVFMWDGVTPYNTTTVGTNSNATFFATINIPINNPPGQVQNHTFHWHVFYGGQLKESTPENVTVINSQYAICNFSGNSTLNIPYFNINYKDETTNLPINATIVSSIWNFNITGSPYGEQYIFSSPSVNGSQTTSLQHQFCFTPSFASIIIPSATYQYGNPTAGFATKIWPFLNLQLSNSSTTYTLYMINLVDSGTTPVTFQTISSQTNTVVSNVRVQVYRTISGTPTLVDDGYTDAAGTVSFYMSPITSYTVVAFGGPGCSQLTSTITPTSSQYNILLSCSGTQSGTPLTTQLDGVTFTRTPADGITAPGNLQYTYHIQSTFSNLTRVKFQLIDAQDGTVLATNDSLTNTATCTASDCFLTINYLTVTGDNVKGRYYAAINGTADSDLVLIEGDAFWRFIIINQNNSVNAFGRLMLNVQDFFDTWGTNTVNCMKYNIQASCNADPQCKWVNQTLWAPSSSTNYQQTQQFCVARDDLNKAEFNRIVTIFFFFVVFLFILGRTTGYELNHPGAFVAGMSAVIWILSLYGMFTFQGLTQYQFFNQYIFALSSSCVGLGYIISVVRRYSG